jgi:hypothetical protein
MMEEMVATCKSTERQNTAVRTPNLEIQDSFLYADTQLRNLVPEETL